MATSNRMTHRRKLVLATLLPGLLGAGSAYAAAVSSTGVFDMYDPTNTLINTDTTVTGNFDTAGNTWAVSSTAPFYGLQWTATNGVLYGAGSHTINLDDSGSGGVGSGTTTLTVPAGKLGGHIKFAWGATTGIDVLAVWTISYTDKGVTKYTVTDLDGDGNPGWGMVDGPFPNFEANFNMQTQAFTGVDLAITQGGVSAESSQELAGGNITIDSGFVGGTYDWSASHASIVASAVGGTANQTLVINPATVPLAINGGPNSDGVYPVKVNITSGADTVTAAINITIRNTTLGAGTDTDGDGVNDAADGVGDPDGDGIPAYLDSISDTKKLQTVNTDPNSRVLVVSSGNLALGETATANASGTNYNAVVTIGEIGTSDSAATNSCVGDCFDFTINGLANNGDIVKLVLPLSAEIPQNPVYRKFLSGSWTGFKVRNSDTLSSAAATGSGASQCPAPGDSAYDANPGKLTPGHYCVQLTIQDGGPNDDDGVANKSISDPGGVASIHLFAPSTQVGGGGCSLSNSRTGMDEHADWLLLAGFILWTGYSVRRRKI